MTFSKVNFINFRHKLFRLNSYSTLKSGRDTVATEELCSKNRIAKAHAVDFTENSIDNKPFKFYQLRNKQPRRFADWKVAIPV